MFDTVIYRAFYCHFQRKRIFQFVPHPACKFGVISQLFALPHQFLTVSAINVNHGGVQFDARRKLRVCPVKGLRQRKD